MVYIVFAHAQCRREKQIGLCLRKNYERLLIGILIFRVNKSQDLLGVKKIDKALEMADALFLSNSPHLMVVENFSTEM